MSLLKKWALCIFSIYGFIWFLVLMFLLFPFFLIAFMQKPVKAGNAVITLSRIWADAFFFGTGIRSRLIYDAPVDKDAEYIFVSNHISYLDIPMMMKVTKGQNVRILAKASMGSIPVFGSIYRRGTVMVDRESPEARAGSIQKLKKFISKKISILICPEGTFNTTGKPLKFFYNGAFRIAIETQKPIKPVLFLDTYDRLHYRSIFSLCPGKCRAVFLPEIDTAGREIEDVEDLKAEVYSQMESALIAYKAPWIRS